MLLPQWVCQDEAVADLSVASCQRLYCGLCFKTRPLNSSCYYKIWADSKVGFVFTDRQILTQGLSLCSQDFIDSHICQHCGVVWRLLIGATNRDGSRDAEGSRLSSHPVLPGFCPNQLPTLVHHLHEPTLNILSNFSGSVSHSLSHRK